MDPLTPLWYHSALFRRGRVGTGRRCPVGAPRQIVPARQRWASQRFACTPEVRADLCGLVQGHWAARQTKEFLNGIAVYAREAARQATAEPPPAARAWKSYAAQEWVCPRPRSVERRPCPIAGSVALPVAVGYRGLARSEGPESSVSCFGTGFEDVGRHISVSSASQNMEVGGSAGRGIGVLRAAFPCRRFCARR